MAKYNPPKGTELTVIHDIYGRAIHVYFPKGDKISPKNCEAGIRAAQLGQGKKQPKKYDV